MAGILEKIANQAAGNNDIVLALMIVTIIFMMIIPLPTQLIDVLIAINMCMASILIMVSLYLPGPLGFSSFPSVLLITTLFRLGISIATTRMILLQGDAGHIVFTFGNFVVGGNIVVGLVIFLIITIVQFIVITKGAERVAEVAARFSLDAMPGKQMSIDGDMRAGAINAEEAKHKRLLVEKESQLYGAMDGAMKFVKGDAIAGIIIVIINLIGGMIIGMAFDDMSASRSIHKYSVLSIGDGLVSQIPALFISICAGIIVTRVSSDGNSNVAKDISNQITAQPKAIIIGSSIMLGMACVPGMPTITFLTMAFIFGIIGYSIIFKSKIHNVYQSPSKDKINSSSFGASDPVTIDGKPLTNESIKELSLTVPLILEVDSGLEKSFSAKILNEELLKIRHALYMDMGVKFPGIQLRYVDSIEKNGYIILLNEVPVSRGYLKPNHILVRETSKTLDVLGVEYVLGENFLSGIDTIWVNETVEPSLTQANIKSMGLAHVLTYHLAVILKKYAADFIGIQETKNMISSMEDKYPDLVKELMRVMPIQKISEIFQRLIAEDISLRNLRTIIESLIDWGQKEKDGILLTEYVRASLKRQICFKHARDQHMLAAYLLSPDLEDTIRNSIRQTSAGSYLSLEPNASKTLISSIKKAVGNTGFMIQKPVLLTSMDIRRYIRKLIEQEIYELAVLSYQELTPEINVQPLARIEK